MCDVCFAIVCSLSHLLLFFFFVPREGLFCNYRIRPNYRTMRLGFSKLLETPCSKILT